jgi:hypothetical protein
MRRNRMKGRMQITYDWYLRETEKEKKQQEVPMRASSTDSSILAAFESRAEASECPTN